MAIKRAIHFTIRKLWLAVIILLVTAAVLLSVARIALPYAENYRASIEQQINQRYDQDISIASLNADWGALGPMLVLESLEFNLSDEYPHDLSVQRAHVQLNFWQSLLQRDWVFEHFVLSGVTAHYHYQPGNGDAKLPEGIESLFLRQLEHFEVRDSQFTLYIGAQKPRTIQIDLLTWRRDGDRRQATGRFQVPDVTANALNFTADLDGDSLQQLSGSIYVEAQSLDISPWLTQVTTTSDILRTEFNVQGWLDVSAGQFRSGQVELGENILEWERSGENHRLVTRPTTWTVEPRTDGWLMNSTPLLVELDDREWPLDRVIWRYRDGAHRWNLADIEIFDFAPLWGLFGRPGEVVADWSDGLQAQGFIREAQIQLTQSRNWQFYVRADELGWLPFQAVPGIEGLQLEVWSTQNEGRFELTGEQVNLASPSTFTDKKTLSEFSVNGHWNQRRGFWEFAVADAYFQLPNADVRQSMRFTSRGGDPVQVEWLLTGGSRGMDVFDVVALLPLQLGNGLSEYLTESLQRGQIDALSMAWRGALTDLPYMKAEGVLQARALIRDLNFQFRPEWPAILNTEAELVFEHDSLHIRTRGGELHGIALGDVHGEITPLVGSPTKLYIRSDVDATAEQLKALFEQSPLADTVAATLAIVQPDGQLQGSFTLDIPFSDEPVIAQGTVDLNGQDIYIEPVALTLQRVHGELSFHNDQIRFHSDDAHVFDQPISLSLQGGTGEEHPYVIKADIFGSWTSESLQKRFPEQANLQLLQGRLEHQAEFTLNLKNEGFDYQWLMDTQLADMEMRLPAPLGKAAGTSAKIVTQVNGNQERLQARAQLGEHAQVRGDMQLGEGFHAFEIIIGDSPVVIGASPADGLSAYLGLSSAVLEEWLPLVVGLVTPQVNDTDELQILPPFRRLEGRIDELHTAGQTFAHTQIRGAEENGGWSIDIDADNVRGKIGSNDDSDILRLNLDFLDLQRLPEDTTDERVVADRRWLDELPAMQVTCRICRYDDQLLGEIRFEFQPNNYGAQINALDVRRGNTRLQGSAGWRPGEPTQSILQGQFESGDVGALLGDLGFNSTVRDSSASIRYQLQWQGGLLDWNTETLSGQVDWQLGPGYLRDVSDGGARIFSVLSMESILRKLTLDFRDIFARGMFYSSFGGTLNLEQGIVRTENTRMNGAAGDMTVRGQTNLADETLDYQLTYVPKVTSSIPVLLAFMVNPPSGLAALFIDRMLHDAQVISRLQYQISGTMSDPVVTEVRRDATEVELPEMADDVLPRELPEHIESQRENSGQNE
ncbi:YhdP family protein [Aliidiomarina indica]|uniref:YhdP family protein n=1 Tax=Aliidiomarina indica TaxID=2749147 RepID=UPI00188FC7DD